MRVATVPTVYGIETAHEVAEKKAKMLFVATVPTVYGIETVDHYILYLPG